jgi:hypothetical protein
MLRRSILLLISVAVMALSACEKSPAPDATSSEETCPLVDAGPPAVCPDGCKWNGKECKKYRSIIMDGARDGGTPPASTR